MKTVVIALTLITVLIAGRWVEVHWSAGNGRASVELTAPTVTARQVTTAHPSPARVPSHRKGVKQPPTRSDAPTPLEGPTTLKTKDASFMEL